MAKKLTPNLPDDHEIERNSSNHQSRLRFRVDDQSSAGFSEVDSLYKDAEESVVDEQASPSSLEIVAPDISLPDNATESLGSVDNSVTVFVKSEDSATTAKSNEDNLDASADSPDASDSKLGEEETMEAVNNSEKEVYNSEIAIRTVINAGHMNIFLVDLWISTGDKTETTLRHSK